MPKLNKIINSKLDIFSLPPEDVSYVSRERTTVSPFNSVLQTNVPVEFYVVADRLHWIDLSESFVYAKLKVVHKDGSDLATETQIAPLNYIAHTLWDDCELNLNGAVISRTNTNYAYKSYIKTQICQGEVAKENYLQQALYTKESNIGVFNETNISYEFLRKQCQGSKSFEVVFKPLESLFQQSKLLPPGTELRLKLRRNTDVFVLKGPESTVAQQGIENLYTLKIEDITFHPCLVEINSEIHSKHIQRMAKGEKAHYVIPVSDVKTYSVLAGTSSYIISDPFSKRIPEFLVIGLVDGVAFQGDFSKNPFNFKDFGLSSVQVIVDGENNFYQKIDTDLETSKFLLGYRSLFSVHSNPQTIGNYISREDYMNGNFLLAFNLNGIDFSRDRSTTDSQKTMKIELTFKTGIRGNIQVIVYGQTESTVTINHKGDVEIENSRLQYI